MLIILTVYIYQYVSVYVCSRARARVCVRWVCVIFVSRCFISLVSVKPELPLLLWVCGVTKDCTLEFPWRPPYCSVWDRASDMNCLLVYCDCTHHSWPPSGKHFMSAVSSRVTSRHEGKRGHHWRETAVINTLWSGIATATREWSVRYYITLSAWQTYEGVKCRILYYINVATKKCGVRFFTLSPGQRRSEV